jgi:hypothetical protein
MSPLLLEALSEAETFIAARGWRAPSAPTLHEAQRLIEATAAAGPEPSVTVEPDGSVALSWDRTGRGWLKLSVSGCGELAHEGVIDGDDFEQVEPWLADAAEAPLPGWADALLRRLWACDA